MPRFGKHKAAYRFFSNERVSEEEILQGHFQSTKSRCSKTEEPVFVLHDTTEFSYHRENPELIGVTRIVKSGKAYGHPKLHTICGLLMHSSLAVTKAGLPLGLLTAVKFWTRKKLKGRMLKPKINNTRIPIDQKESIRWLENLKDTVELLKEPKKYIHIGDWESDIYELFCLANELDTHFLVRSRLDCACGTERRIVMQEINDTKVKGLHCIEVRDKKGEKVNVLLEIKYKKLKILPSKAKESRYPEVNLTVIHATERSQPKNREKINWELVTNMPVTSSSGAIEKLNWYAMRWKIGVSSQGHCLQSVKVRPRLKRLRPCSLEGIVARKQDDGALRQHVRQGICAMHQVVTCSERRSSLVTRNPVAETVYNARKQQGLLKRVRCNNTHRRGISGDMVQRKQWKLEKTLNARWRKTIEEANTITVSGKCGSWHQGCGSGHNTDDRCAAKRIRREGPGSVNNPCVKERQW